MRMKTALPSLIAAVVVLFAATGVLFVKYQKAAAVATQSRNDEEATRVRYGQAINEIATIQDSLNAIVLGDEAARLIPYQLENELKLSGTHGDQALEHIAVLKAGIERTKDRIQQLDANLKKNGVKISGLEKMVARLRTRVKEKEQMVAQLTVQVDSLNTQVTGLVADVEDKQRELGTIYYTIGSKKELTQSGVIVAKGGVLGVGKTLKPSGQVNEYSFSPLNTDQETVIRIPSHKVQVLTAQPVASYELQAMGDVVELHILDPKEFRKIKHLVIMTV